MATIFTKRPFWVVLIGILLVAGTLATPAGRGLAQRWLNSLRLQKVQAVNLDFLSVHQMVSDKVDVTVNEPNQPVSDRSSASTTAGFPVQLTPGLVG
jgi:hypothetical protein